MFNLLDYTNSQCGSKNIFSACSERVCRRHFM